jgi:hypothetical protein
MGAENSKEPPEAEGAEEASEVARKEKKASHQLQGFGTRAKYERALAAQRAAVAAGRNPDEDFETQGTGRGPGTVFNPQTGSELAVPRRETRSHARNDTQHFEAKTFPSGNKYEGEWLRGVYHGRGKLHYADGRNYDGEWCEGVMHGKGHFAYANGDQYMGEYRAGQQEGQGRFVWRNGDIYAGEWHQGKRHGKGNLTKVNGDGFKGYWTKGHPDMQLFKNPHRPKK